MTSGRGHETNVNGSTNGQTYEPLRAIRPMGWPKDMASPLHGSKDSWFSGFCAHVAFWFASPALGQTLATSPHRSPPSEHHSVMLFATGSAARDWPRLTHHRTFHLPRDMIRKSRKPRLTILIGLERTQREFRIASSNISSENSLIRTQTLGGHGY